MVLPILLAGPRLHWFTLSSIDLFYAKLKHADTAEPNATPGIAVAANHANGKFLGRNEEVHINHSN